jgi:hypothetical protein
MTSVRGPGPTAQPWLRPCVNSRSMEEPRPPPASGASAGRPWLDSGASAFWAPRSGASAARRRRVWVGGVLGVNSEADNGTNDGLNRFGRVAIDTEHLPARRG